MTDQELRSAVVQLVVALQTALSSPTLQVILQVKLHGASVPDSSG